MHNRGGGAKFFFANFLGSGTKRLEEYSLSTFEGENDILRIYKFFKQKRNPKTIIAKGATATSCGIVQRTAERTGQSTSHVDWWLYENAEPHRFFQPYEIV